MVWFCGSTTESSRMYTTLTESLGPRRAPCWSRSEDPRTRASGQGSTPCAPCLPSRHGCCRDLGTAARRQQTLGLKNSRAHSVPGNTLPPARQLGIRAAAWGCGGRAGAWGKPTRPTAHSPPCSKQAAATALRHYLPQLKMFRTIFEKHQLILLLDPSPTMPTF